MRGTGGTGKKGRGRIREAGLARGRLVVETAGQRRALTAGQPLTAPCVDVSGGGIGAGRGVAAGWTRCFGSRSARRLLRAGTLAGTLRTPATAGIGATVTALGGTAVIACTGLALTPRAGPSVAAGGSRGVGSCSGTGISASLASRAGARLGTSGGPGFGARLATGGTAVGGGAAGYCGLRARASSIAGIGTAARLAIARRPWAAWLAQGAARRSLIG